MITDEINQNVLLGVNMALYSPVHILSPEHCAQYVPPDVAELLIAKPMLVLIVVMSVANTDPGSMPFFVSSVLGGVMLMVSCAMEPLSNDSSRTPPE